MRRCRLVLRHLDKVSHHLLLTFGASESGRAFQVSKGTITDILTAQDIAGQARLRQHLVYGTLNFSPTYT